MGIKDRYDEIFEVEVDGWCYGITNFPGEIFPGLVHRIIKELAPTLHEAVTHNFVFNVADVASRFEKATKYLVPQKEIAFSILMSLPHPSALNEDGQYVVAMLVDQVEQAYGGALERIQKKWAHERRRLAA